MSRGRKPGLLVVVAPGLLLAATGVGAGDLATAAFSGSRLGCAVLWAVVVGALMKFVLTEGLARWQLATGTTFLEGAADRWGRVLTWVFLPYLFLWTFFVGSALMSACGVTFHALVPWFEDASRAKVVFGVLHSLVGAVLVFAGGFKWFERIMSVCIGAMFCTVIFTAARLWPGTGEVLSGLVPDLSLREEDLTWTVALIGGVGGTLTILCYGYWIREKGRGGAGDLGICRLDLGLGYFATALFGMAMVIIGRTVTVDGRGATLVVDLARSLQEPLGSGGSTVFLLGAWGAVFSSLLGVWQSVPYLFADFVRRARDAESVPLTRTGHYRLYLVLIATVPALGLFVSFSQIQKYYAVVGACLVPMLAVALLIMNGRSMAPAFRSRLPATAALFATLLFFALVLVRKIVG